MNNQPIETSHTLIYTEKYGNNKNNEKKRQQRMPNIRFTIENVWILR